MKASLFWGLLIFLVPSPTLACSPSPGDKWFTVEYSFDEKALPPGVSVEVVPIPSDGRSAAPANSGIKLLRNSSATPLFLKHELGGDPGGFTYKLVDGKAYFYDRTGKLIDGEWKMAGQWVPNDGGPGNIHLLGVEISNFVLSNSAIKNTSADDRPANVKIPENHTIEINAKSGEKDFVMIVQIRYALNQKYDPKRNAKGIQACAKMNAW